MEIADSIWEKILAWHQATAFNFAEFEEEFDIKKLELEKLTAQEIKNKSRDLRKKRQKSQDHNLRSWMENEYRLFIWFMISLSNYYKQNPDTFAEEQWKFIGEIFVKDPKICKYFYFCCKKTPTEKWTPEQDQIIIKLMNEAQTEKKWTQIGVILFETSSINKIRKPKTIRERWLGKLNPDIKKSLWDTEEDLKLLNYILQHGKKWSKISKIIKSRNEHTIKNRYHQLIIRKLLKFNDGSNKMTEQQFLEKKIFQLSKKMGDTAQIIDNDAKHECNTPLESQILTEKSLPKIDESPEMDKTDYRKQRISFFMPIVIQAAFKINTN